MSSPWLLSELKHHVGNPVAIQVIEAGSGSGLGAPGAPVQGTKVHPVSPDAGLRRLLLCRNQSGRDLGIFSIPNPTSHCVSLS